jgi:hypothetical protein
MTKNRKERMPRNENAVIDDMKREYVNSTDARALSRVLGELARELLEIVEPQPVMLLELRLDRRVGTDAEDFVAGLTLAHAEVASHAAGFALDHVRAAWRNEDYRGKTPPPDTLFLIRNVAGAVIGSWIWKLTKK